MSAHTPGPWEADERLASGTIFGPEVDGVQTFVAFVRLDDTRERHDGRIEEVKSKEAKANARLIAAAPDLLEALDLADRLLRGANMNRSVVENKVSAALAKAGGK